MPKLDPIRRRNLAIEIGVVLALAVVPGIVNSIANLARPETLDREFLHDYMNLFAHGLQLCLPVLWIMWKSNEPWATFGIRRFSWRVDVPLAVLFTIAIGMAPWALSIGLSVIVWIVPPMWDVVNIIPAPDGLHFEGPESIVQWAVFIVGLVASCTSEELVCRAYLIPRFQELTGSTFGGIALASGAFASYHLYQGSYGALSVFVVGLVYGAFFVAFRRVWPLVISHVVYDVILIVSS